MMSDPLVILFRTARAAMAAMLLVAACVLGGCANNGAASDSFAMPVEVARRWRSNRLMARRLRCSTAW